MRIYQKSRQRATFLRSVATDERKMHREETIMDEDSPDGCYGIRCRDCELRVTHTIEEHEECRRRNALATERLLSEDE